MQVQFLFSKFYDRKKYILSKKLSISLFIYHKQINQKKVDVKVIFIILKTQQ